MECYCYITLNFSENSLFVYFSANVDTDIILAVFKYFLVEIKKKSYFDILRTKVLAKKCNLLIFFIFVFFFKLTDESYIKRQN